MLVVVVAGIATAAEIRSRRVYKPRNARGIPMISVIWCLLVMITGKKKKMKEKDYTKIQITTTFKYEEDKKSWSNTCAGQAASAKRMSRHSSCRIVCFMKPRAQPPFRSGASLTPPPGKKPVGFE